MEMVVYARCLSLLLFWGIIAQYSFGQEPLVIVKRGDMAPGTTQDLVFKGVSPPVLTANGRRAAFVGNLASGLEGTENLKSIWFADLDTEDGFYDLSLAALNGMEVKNLASEDSGKVLDLGIFANTGLENTRNVAQIALDPAGNEVAFVARLNLPENLGDDFSGEAALFIANDAGVRLVAKRGDLYQVSITDGFGITQLEDFILRGFLDIQFINGSLAFKAVGERSGSAGLFEYADNQLEPLFLSPGFNPNAYEDQDTSGSWGGPKTVRVHVLGRSALNARGALAYFIGGTIPSPGVNNNRSVDALRFRAGPGADFVTLLKSWDTVPGLPKAFVSGFSELSMTRDGDVVTKAFLGEFDENNLPTFPLTKSGIFHLNTASPGSPPSLIAATGLEAAGLPFEGQAPHIITVLEAVQAAGKYAAYLAVHEEAVEGGISSLSLYRTQLDAPGSELPVFTVGADSGVEGLGVVDLIIHALLGPKGDMVVQLVTNNGSRRGVVHVSPPDETGHSVHTLLTANSITQSFQCEGECESFSPELPALGYIPGGNVIGPAIGAETGYGTWINAFQVGYMLSSDPFVGQDLNDFEEYGVLFQFGEPPPVIPPFFVSFFPESDASEIMRNAGVGVLIDPGNVGFDPWQVSMDVDGNPVPLQYEQTEDGLFRYLYHAPEPFGPGVQPAVQVSLVDHDGNLVQDAWAFQTTSQELPPTGPLTLEQFKQVEDSVELSVTGGEGPFAYQYSPNLRTWQQVLFSPLRNATLPLQGVPAFFRVMEEPAEARPFVLADKGNLVFSEDRIQFAADFSEVSGPLVCAILRVVDGATGKLKAGINVESLINGKLLSGEPPAVFLTSLIDDDDRIFVDLLHGEDGSERTSFQFQPELIPLLKQVNQGEIAASEPTREGFCTDGTCVYRGATSCNECEEIQPITYLQTGEFSLEEQPLKILGRGDVHFSIDLVYRSKVEGTFGGWNWGYQECLQEMENGDIMRADGRGHLNTWAVNMDGGYTAPTGYFGTLVKKADGGFVYRQPDGFKRFYDAMGRLAEHRDRRQNSMRFLYDFRGRMNRILDPYHREIRVRYDSENRVDSIEDFCGRRVTFTYDENGYLSAITSPAVIGTSNGNDFPQGRTKRFGYLSGFAGNQAWLNGNLSEMYLPNEVASGGDPALTVFYDEVAASATFDSVTGYFLGGTNESGVSAGGMVTYEYVNLNSGEPAGQPELPRGKVVITQRDGTVVEYFANEHGHHIITRVWTKGLREAEPDYYETVRTFDADGQLLTAIFPEGNELHQTWGTGPRAAQCRVMERRLVAGPRGGGEDLVTSYSYEPLFNRVRSVTGARGNAAGFVPPIGFHSAQRYRTTHYFDYQESFDEIAESSEFGIDLFEIQRGLGDLNGDGLTEQTMGNLIKTEKPSVQLLSDSNEAARIGSTSQAVITLLSYNEAGQCIREVDPEGNVTLREYYPGSDPDGDGFPVPGSTETGDTGFVKSKTADALDLPGRLTESPPAMITTRFGYDKVGNVVRAIDGRGVVTAHEYNALNEQVSVTRAATVETGLPAGGGAPAYRTSIRRDHNGNIVRTDTDNRDTEFPEDGLGDTVTRTYTYDRLNNVVRRTAEVDGSTTLAWEMRYDPEEFPVEKTEPEDNRIVIERDERHLPFRTTRGQGSPESATYRYDYDRNGNLARFTDAEDNDGDGQPEETLLEFDGFDRLIRTTDALGNETRHEYDPASNLVRKQAWGHPANEPGSPNVLHAEVSYQHDELNRVFKVENTLFVAGGFNPLRPVNLPDGDSDGLVETRIEYDALSRLTWTVEDDGEDTRTIYDGVGRPVERIDALGNRLQVNYDANSNPLTSTKEEISPEDFVPEKSLTTRYVWDALNRMVRVSDNLGQTTRFAYDSRDNLVHRSDAEGAVIADPLGIVPGNINAPGNTRSYRYDGLDRLVRATTDLRVDGTGGGGLDTSNPYNPDGQIDLSYEYDGNSRLTGVTDDNGNRTTFAYDALDRRITQTWADGEAFEAVHDRDNNVIQITDPNGSVIAKSCDALNRLVQVDVNRAAGVLGTTRETYQYDGLSRLTRSSDDNGDPANIRQTDFVYNSLSRIVEDQQTHAGGTRVVSATWTGDHKRVQQVYPGGRVIDNAFDAIDRVSAINDGLGQISSHSYAGSGSREIFRSFGNGSVLSYLNDAGNAGTGYDGMNRVVRMRHSLDGTPSTAFVDREYTYNRANRLTAEIRHDDFGRMDQYAYDSAYRLVSADYDVGGAGGMARDLMRETYQYDGVGNRRAVNKVSGTQEETADLYEINDVNEYVNIAGVERTHSSKGNLTSDGVFDYGYDYRNRLVRVTGTATGKRVSDYQYDCGNRRMRKTVYDPETEALVSATDYYYSGSQCVEERDAATGDMTATYVWGTRFVDELIQYERTGHHAQGAGRFWVHTDARNDVAAITDAGRNVVERRTYDAFGRMLDADKTPMTTPGASGLEFGFQGRRMDFESGLYDFRNRHYDPSTARFLQRDPVWDVSNYGGWHTFAGNDPWNGTDPRGPEDERKDALDMLGDAAYTVFVGWWFDPLSEFVDKYGFEGLFYAIGSGVCAVATLPLEFVEAFQSYDSIKETIVEQFGEMEEAGVDIADRIRDIAGEQRSEYNRSHNPELFGPRRDTRTEWDKLQAHYNSDLHRRFGYYVQWLTGGKITAWDAMNMWPSGGLTGVAEDGTNSPALENVACMHDALISLFADFQVGPGAGFCRETNVFAGMVSNWLRVVLDGGFGFTGFGEGEAGVDRPVSSLPGESVPEADRGNSSVPKYGGIFELTNPSVRFSNAGGPPVSP